MYESGKEKYHCIFRGKKATKNKGVIEIYLVDGDIMNLF